MSKLKIRHYKFRIHATSLAIAIYSVIDDFFTQIINDVKQISLEFGAQDQANRKILDPTIKSSTRVILIK